MIFLATLLFPLALRMFSDDPPPPGPGCRWRPLAYEPAMGRLDQIDLSKSLSRSRSSAASRTRRRASPSSADARGADRPADGPAVLVLFEGWDASGKGAIKRLVAPIDPRHVASPSSPRRPPTRSATTSSGASGTSCPDRGGWRSSTAAGTGGSWSSGSRALPRARQPPLRRDQQLRALAHRRGDDPDQVLAPHLRRRAAQAVQRRERDPLKAWKLTEDDWGNRESVPPTGGRRGHAGAKRPAERPWSLIGAESKPTPGSR